MGARRMWHKQSILFWACFSSLLSSCKGETLVTDEQGVDVLTRPCVGDNDGQIERGEILFETGLAVRYRFVDGSDLGGVHPDGEETPGGGRAWDFRGLAGVIRKILIEPVADKWFRTNFTSAQYAVVTACILGGDCERDPNQEVLSLFEVREDRILLLGAASRGEGLMILPYGKPVDALIFPLRTGSKWTVRATIIEGQFGGLTFNRDDQYDFFVPTRGTLYADGVQFLNTLRLDWTVVFNAPGAQPLTSSFVTYWHECFGEIARAEVDTSASPHAVKSLRVLTF